MKPKVLIVDDETLVRLLYQRHIEKSGYQLLTATSAEEGLATVQQEKPALVIMDVMMGGADGLAALRSLKADPATKSIPVMIFSGMSVGEHYATRQQAMACGAAAYLNKPASPDQLVAEISRLVPIADASCGS
jgi:twitching motility two-component system response regulator PilH